MRKLILSSAVILAFAGGSSALAAGKPMAAKTSTAAAPANGKQADCVKQWKAEKKHSQTRKAFMASCLKS